MPTYEHICQNGHEFEEFQSMVAPPVEVCPICGASAVRKISGGTGLIFKGSGFYITDYAKKNSSGKPVTTEKSIESKGSSTESTSDSAPKTTPSAPSTGSDSKQ